MSQCSFCLQSRPRDFLDWLGVRLCCQDCYAEQHAIYVRERDSFLVKRYRKG